MRRMIFLCSLAAAGCLNTGCVVSPMKASDLFGVSNPAMEARVAGYGSIKIPTNFDGDFQLEKRPDGSTAVHLNFKSNAAQVVDAEGKRLIGMESQRIADENRAIAQEQIRSAERVELYRMVASSLPLLAQLAGPKSPTPEQQPARVGPFNLSPELWDIINNAIDSRIRGVAPPQ